MPALSHLKHAALAAGLIVAAGSLAPAPWAMLWAQPAQAGSLAVEGSRIAQLGDAMQLGPLLAVIREEGLAYGDGLDQSVLAGTGGIRWRAEVARIYDPAASRKVIEAALLASLSREPEALQAMEDYFATPLGARIAGLEVQARRAFLDPAARDSATVAWQDLDEKGGARATALHHLVEAAGLIDQNVQGTLNADLALYKGLAQGGGLKSPMTAGDLAARVASQEPRARAAAEAWLYPYLALAYQPLTDQELDTYVAFLTSPSGQKANQALFHAFDALFSGIAHDLGLAASRRLAGQEI